MKEQKHKEQRHKEHKEQRYKDEIKRLHAEYKYKLAKGEKDTRPSSTSTIAHRFNKTYTEVTRDYKTIN